MQIKKIEQISKNDTTIAGGKGASLGEMIQAGVSIPDAFVVLSSVFDDFILEAGIKRNIDDILATLDSEDSESIGVASDKIRKLILMQTFPKEVVREIEKNFRELDARFVAVRSSATAEDGVLNAWAGQLETYLNTTKDNLFENIKKCWASLFSPRAITYRLEKGQKRQVISVAVVVQKMIDSEVSGVCFTSHPVTLEKNHMIIEAGFGLGEAIVGGKITPDSYIIDKEHLSIVKVNVSNQEMKIIRGAKGGTEEVEVEKSKGQTQKINNVEILELSRLCKKIEKHYGFPCDIEWAFACGNFYILQSRPITTF